MRVYQHQFDRHENLYFQKYSTVEYVEIFLPSPAFNRNLPSPTFNKIESHFRVLFGQHLIFSVRILVSGRVGLVVCSTYIPFVFPLVETMFIRDRVFCEHFLGFVLRCFFYSFVPWDENHHEQAPFGSWDFLLFQPPCKQISSR